MDGEICESLSVVTTYKEVFTGACSYCGISSSSSQRQ